MRVAGGGREPSSPSAAGVALRALLIATACGLVFALLNLPDGRAASLSTGECRSPHTPGPVTA
jgi:alpha-1,4-galacturonosyltransferase